MSGKVNFYKNKYQITNPDYVTTLDKQDYVLKNIPKYNLTKGINEKKYRLISEQVIKNLPLIDDWLSKDFVKKNDMMSWNESINQLHNSNESRHVKSKSYRRLVFDEILANFLTLSQNRKRIKKEKKTKTFKKTITDKIIKKLPFSLTESQKEVLNQINIDLANNKRMFRVLQGDVGCGKTIVALLSIANVLECNYQCALMGPTEILSYQHFNLAREIFDKMNFKIEFLSGKTDLAKRKKF